MGSDAERAMRASRPIPGYSSPGEEAEERTTLIPDRPVPDHWACCRPGAGARRLRSPWFDLAHHRLGRLSS